MHMLRLARTGLVLARHGALDDALPQDAPAPAKLAARLIRLAAGRGRQDADGNALAAAIETLGPSYIKLGQFLATRADVVGQERARQLSRLQDKLPPFAQAEAIRAVEASLGGRIDDLFIAFGEPVAAASIAQVHKAQVRAGDGRVRDVAVKVLRPGIEQRFARDLDEFYFVARFADRHIAPARRLKPVAVVDTLAKSVALEMDLRMEAAAISEMAENVANDAGFRVPQVDWTRSAKRVLTLDWIDGTPLSDHEALIAAGHDLKHLAQVLIQSFLRHAMRDGFFHADMHQGNLFVDAAGNIIAVDFGIMGRLGPKEQRFLAEILWGFIRRDYKRVAEVHFEAGYVPPKHHPDNFAQALRAIGEPLMDRVAEEVSMAKLLTQLLQVTELFDMETRPELLLLQKTMVVVEGVARGLDPQLDMWTAAEPAVREWIEANLGPEGRLQDAAEGAATLGRFVGHIPGLLARAENTAEQFAAMAQQGVRLDHETVEAIARARARRERSGRIALWIGALALAAIAFNLLM